MKKKHSMFWKISACLSGLLVLLCIFLQSPPGKALLASGISKALSGSGSSEVRVGRISGIIPARIELESLELVDPEGIWLTARQLRFRWAMKDMFNGIVNIAHLGAESIEIHRIPKASRCAPKTKEKGRYQPMELTLGNLKIESLILGKAIAGVPLRYSAHSGGMQLHANGELSGTLDVTGDASGRLQITAPPLGAEAYLLQVFAELTELRKPEIGLRGLHATLEATLSADTTVVALIAAADEIELGMDARVAVTGGSWNIDLQRLDVEYINTVRFSLQGSIGHKRVGLKGTLAEFDVGQLPLIGASNFTGRISGRVSMEGPLAAPKLDAVLDVFDLTTSQVAVDELPDLDFHINIGLDSGLVYAASGITNAVSGSMAANAEMPCAFSLQPWRFHPERERLKCSFSAGVDLGILNGLSILNNERIAGQLASKLTYDGQADQKLLGQIAISDGSYEHYDWGVVVRNIQGELTAESEGLVIKDMRASDGNNGRVEVAGRVGLWQAGIPLDLKVDIEKAGLIHRDELDGILSGVLHLGGLLARPSVQGNLVVDRAEILLDNIARPEPRLLTSFDVYAQTNATDTILAKKEMPFTMDIDVSMPTQIFVNSSVIDSVWGGELRLKDAPGGISVAGVIQPRRGYLSFIGKKFRLLDDGRIDLDGTVPPSPSINIRAEYSRSDLVAQLALTGKLNNPKYTLTSSPALPEDEILSYVLFGRETSSITPYQALQLAAAARQLSGGTSGAGFIYQVRQALSIDTLEWREPDTENGSSSVAAGKYITPGLYVEVNSTVGSQDANRTGFLAEYELTRHFSVETSTGPQMRPGIGLNWKNDY